MLVAGLDDMNCFSLQNEICPNANISFWLYT